MKTSSSNSLGRGIVRIVSKKYNRKVKLIILLLGYELLSMISSFGQNAGFEISVSSFYLVPITLITIFVGKKHGLLIAFIISIFQGFIGKIWLGHGLSYLWNTAVIFVIYYGLVVIISEMRIALLIEQRQSRIDELTGLYNYKGFAEICKRELVKCRRAKTKVTLAYIDCDNFKYINDNFGHETGNKLLKVVSSVMRGELRRTSIIGRYGGDEFVLFLTDMSYIDSKKVFERLNQRLLLAMKENGWDVTFSIGIGYFVDLSRTINIMLNKTDKLMYQVKHGGKNGIVIEIL